MLYMKLKIFTKRIEQYNSDYRMFNLNKMAVIERYKIKLFKKNSVIVLIKCSKWM